MTDIQGIAGRYWPKIKKLIDEFNVAIKDSPQDLNRLSEIAAKCFDFELKVVPALNKEPVELLKVQNLCMVTCVGMQIQPILLNIAILKPKSIVFVHTGKNRDQVGQIKNSMVSKDLYGREQPFTAQIEINPTDTTQTYEKLAKVIKEGKSNNWVVDITGGKKVMGATLSAFAFWRRIPVFYLDSREVQGITEPFSESLKFIDNPYSTYGDPILQTAAVAFNNHQFKAAIDALDQLRMTVSLIKLDHMASVASNLVYCYMLWDRFEHSNDSKIVADKFHKGFETASEQYDRFKYNFLDSKVFHANRDFIKQLRSTYKPSKASLIDEYRLVDVYCNSRRRSQQNLFDDAVARLYRCTEMAATMALEKLIPKFNPDKVDWNALCKKHSYANLEEIYIRKSAKLSYNKVKGLPQTPQLGLAQQIVLLAVFAELIRENQYKSNQYTVATAKAAESIFDIYATNKDNTFALRNRSILAHGTKPLTEKVYQDFNEVALKICQHAVGKQTWNELVKQAHFPKITFTI